MFENIQHQHQQHNTKRGEEGPLQTDTAWHEQNKKLLQKQLSLRIEPLPLNILRAKHALNEPTDTASSTFNGLQLRL
jgi:hypothetical protein